MNISLRKRYLTQAVLLLSLICYSQAIHLSQGHLDTDQALLSSKNGISSTADHINTDSLASSTRHRSFFTLSGNTENTSVGSTDSQSNQQRIPLSSVSQQQNSKVTQSDSNDQNDSESAIGSSNAQTSSTGDSEKLTQKNGKKHSASLSSASTQSSKVPQKPSSSTIRKVEKGKYVGKRAKTGEEFPIQIIGEDDTSFFPKTPKQFQADEEEYDVIIVGGGLSSMVGAIYLTDNQKKVLMLEKQKQMGGLAVQRKNKEGIAFGGGASYWDKATGEQLQLMIHIGVDPAKEDYSIPQPFDVYLWNGVLYGVYPHRGVWDDRTIGLKPPAEYPNGNGTLMPVLPASFALFKLQCKNEDDNDRIPDQPIEQWKNMELDQIDAATWIRNMPQKFHKRILQANQDDDSESDSESDTENSESDTESESESESEGDYQIQKALWARFQQQIEDGILDKDDPMKDVIEFVELYCREALGTIPKEISAMAFAYFYIAEFQVRYTSSYGTGLFTHNMLENLKTKPQLATLKTQAPVINVKNTEDGVEVRYIQNGKGRIAKGKMVYYGSQLGFAPQLVEGLSEKAPEQAETMRSLQMCHYSVHCVSVTNHPYRLSFNTDIRDPSYSLKEFTDVSISRWYELRGYKKSPSDTQRKLRWDYSVTPDDKGSAFCLWHPLMKVNASKINHKTAIYGDNYAASIAEHAYNRFQRIFDEADLFGQDFKVVEMDTNRWPYAMNIPVPGHFEKKSKVMGQTFGNVVFGNSNLGTPSFEEAIFRGHCGANRILYRLDPESFVQESWSKCNYKA